MPGDGITDVAPLTQNQEKGRSAAPQYRRRREDYVYFDGWIELLWQWWPGIQDASNYPCRTRPRRQRDPRVPQTEVRDEWLFAPTIADVSAQSHGVQEHGWQPVVRRKAPVLPRQYRPSFISIEEMIDPVFVSNNAAWVPSIDIYQESSVWMRCVQNVTRGTSLVQYSFALQMPEILIYSAIPTTLGTMRYTGGTLTL